MSVSRSGNVYTKTDHQNPEATQLEALELQWLADAMPNGGAHVVPVVKVSKGSLSTRAVSSSRVTSEAAEQFGRALALTHAAGADWFGQAPTGWDGDGWMGMAPMSYISEDAAYESWGDFFAHERILPHLPPAVDNGAIDSWGIKIVEQLCERLRDGDFDSPQPALVQTQAARIHGDLWSGNVIWSPTADIDWAPEKAGLGTKTGALPETVGVLIDPAANGGHAEKDLADLSVFGQPYLDRIYAGYNAESKLEGGWRERIGLHQMHILMVHAHLFGGSYGSQTVSVARKYVK